MIHCSFLRETTAHFRILVSPVHTDIKYFPVHGHGHINSPMMFHHVVLRMRKVIRLLFTTVMKMQLFEGFREKKLWQSSSRVLPRVLALCVMLPLFLPSFIHWE